MGCGHWYERSSSGEWQWGTETRCMLLCASLLDWIFGRSTTSEVKEATRTLYPNANTLPELFGPSACNPNMRSPKRINCARHRLKDEGSVGSTPAEYPI